MTKLYVLALAVFVAKILATDIFREDRMQYDGYEVLEISPDTDVQEIFVNDLIQDLECDVWASSQRKVTVSVSPEKVDEIKAALDQQSISYNIQIQNLQESVEEEMTRMFQKSRNQQTQFDFDDFNTYENIIEEMDHFVTRCPPDMVCENYVIGQSYEGRDLKVFKITKGGEGRRGLWFDSAVHAREWLAPATLLKILDHLLTNYECDEVVRDLFTRYDWYFLPIANPDGYVFSWEQERYWRKNRMPNEGSSCIGTDLNRNFDSHWGNAGTSTDPCSEIYGGESAASAPETLAMQNEAIRLGSSLNSWVTIHSYSEMWLTPYGYTDADGSCHISEDYDDLMTVVNAMADATESIYNSNWVRGTSCEAIYPASGGTEDFAKESGGVKYTFTPELRGTNFVVPTTEIEPSFREIWHGVVAMITAIENLEQ